VSGHRLVRVLDEVEQDLLDLTFVGHDRPNTPELGDDLDAVAAQLVALELQHPLDLILEAAAKKGLELRLTKAADEWLAEAENAGLGDKDYSAVLARILEGTSQVESSER